MTISGAHGRDYKSKAEIEKDWHKGLDFVVRDAFSGGGYINKEDAVSAGIRTVNVRYGNDRKLHVMKVQ